MTTDDVLAIDLAIEMCDHGGPTVCTDCSRRGKRLVPTVQQYAESLVLAERERIIDNYRRVIAKLVREA